jgi:hypothetical protein
MCDYHLINLDFTNVKNTKRDTIFVIENYENKKKVPCIGCWIKIKIKLIL